nr:molybdopterin-dependent oxidoreductase [Bacillus sp. SN32]
MDQEVYNHEYYSEYEKDLSLAKALNPNVLIALEINNEPLTVERGGPVRLVLPGYYGTNSTKWLTHLIVSDSRSNSAFTTKYYVNREVVDGQLKESPVWAVSPNSIIVHPPNGQLVELEEIDIFGWTWAEHPIVTVEVSTDGGESWKEAQVEGRKSVEWQKFSFRWHPKSVGEYLIVVRATDSLGNSQPLTSRRNQVSRAMIFVQNSLNEENLHPNIG